MPGASKTGYTHWLGYGGVSVAYASLRNFFLRNYAVERLNFLFGKKRISFAERITGGRMVFRLKSGIFVRALIRRAEVAGAQGYVVKKGAEEAGAILLKINRLDGNCLVLVQARAGNGEAVWMRPLGDWCTDDKAGAYFEKQQKIDPDLWIVEIEDRQGRTFVDEPVL